MRVSLATEMAPPFVLVAHFFIAGILFLIAASVGFFFVQEGITGYFISFPFAALAHLFLLGFVMMIIFGAMYQLLPVVLEAPVFSKDFAYVQFYLYCIGLSMMVLGFAHDDFTLCISYGGVITYLSILIFCINVFLTFYRLETINLVGKYLLIGTIFLAISVTIGLVVGLSLAHGLFEISINDWVQAHIIGTLGGFVLMIVMGVSMVLLPMFSLAHNFDERLIHYALPLHTAGILGSMLAFTMQAPFSVKGIMLGMVLVSVSLYIVQMLIILKHRARKQNDYWVKNSLFAWLSLALSMLLGVCAFVFENTVFSLTSGFVLLCGFMLPFIVGHIYKIFPFLIWYHKFSPLVGKQKVPLLHQMVHTKMADTQTISLFLAVFIIAFSLLSASVTLYFIGVSIMFLSICLIAYNAWFTFTYTLKD